MNKALLILILAVPLNSLGQTNIATAPVTNEVAVSATNSATILVTNLISGNFLRVVNSKVYDNRNNNQWVTFPSSSLRTMRLTSRVDNNACVCSEMDDITPKRGPLEVGPIVRYGNTGRPNITEPLSFSIPTQHKRREANVFLVGPCRLE